MSIDKHTEYFPKATEQQLKSGWNYSFEFMEEIKKYVHDQGETIDLEAVDAVLKFIESGFIASAPSLKNDLDKLILGYAELKEENEKLKDERLELQRYKIDNDIRWTERESENKRLREALERIIRGYKELGANREDLARKYAKTEFRIGEYEHRIIGLSLEVERLQNELTISKQIAIDKIGEVARLKAENEQLRKLPEFTEYQRQIGVQVQASIEVWEKTDQGIIIAQRDEYREQRDLWIERFNDLESQAGDAITLSNKIDELQSLNTELVGALKKTRHFLQQTTEDISFVDDLIMKVSRAEGKTTTI